MRRKVAIVFLLFGWGAIPFWLQSCLISAGYIAPSLANSVLRAASRWLRPSSCSIIRVRSSRPPTKRLFLNTTSPRSPGPVERIGNRHFVDVFRVERYCYRLFFRNVGGGGFVEEEISKCERNALRRSHSSGAGIVMYLFASASCSEFFEVHSGNSDVLRSF